MSDILKVTNIVKTFGMLNVLQSISFALKSGEVMGLAGRSGAGKSVLIKIISGLQAPDGGEIFFQEQRLQWPFNPHTLKIGVIYQQPVLAEQFDIASNIFLGCEKRATVFGIHWPVPNQSKMDEEAKELLSSLDVSLPSLREKVANLTSEQRQLVAIAQVMARPCRAVLIDDPSPLLSHPYQDKFLEQIRKWQKSGTAVLFSSQNLDHLFAVSDRILVMRQGKMAGIFRTDGTSREAVVAALVGTDDRQQRTPVIWALDSYYQARRQAETLRHNQMLLKRDLMAQDNINRHLLQQLDDQVKALDSANLALQDAQRRLLTEREEERKHLARELHDQLIQDLLSLNYQLEEIQSKTGDNPIELADDLDEVRNEVRSMVEDLRRICGNLRPPTIDSLGLGSALQSSLHSWSERTGILATLHLDINFGRLPEELELSIFRIIQEGLSNVWKHSGASCVEVTLKHTSPRTLLISLADDGTGLEYGFDLSTMGQDGHFGLLGISERVALMGGRLNFENRQSGGLLLQVEVPHPRVTQLEL
ncbi:MAG: ATP-binding cassette domain-containing protein [Candidatus Promineifilaceae bacterium]